MFFFFFKQKTAYEIYQCDWSSDVCSSDLMPVLARTIGVFQPLEMVTGIVVAIEPSHRQRCRDEVIGAYGFSKAVSLVGGGVNRAETVRNALGAVGADTDTVLVHDGARPLFPARLLAEALELLTGEGVDGVVFGLPVTDTIKEVDAAGAVVRTPERSRLWSVQTPQIFRRTVLEEAYGQGPEVLAAATDDAGLVEKAGGRIRMVEGSRENIKLTTPVDLLLAERILEARGGGQ